MRDVLTLTLYTGLRSGEVCRLRDDWLVEGVEAWSIVIPSHEMKIPHADHVVPLVGRALEIARKRRGSDFWFKSRTGGHIKQKMLGVAGLYNQYNYEEERREWLTTLGDHFDMLGRVNP